MAERFLDGELGNDNGSGSISDPWRTFGGTATAAFLAAMGSGDYLRVAGTCRPLSVATLNSYSPLTVTNRTGATIEQWDGRSAAFLRLDAVITGTWTNVSGNSWTISVATGLTVSGMTFNYDSSTYTGQNNQTINYGVMILATGSTADLVAWNAAVDAAAWSMNYDPTSGTIRANFAGQNPNLGVVTLVRGGTTNVATLSGCTGCTIRGIKIGVCGINVGAGGYGGFIFNGTSCVLDSLIFQTLGAHGQANTGGTNVGNIVRSCKSLDLAPNSTGFVTYSDSGNTSGSVFAGNNAHVVGYRAPDGTDCYPTPTSMQGFFCHTSGGSVTIDDSEWRDCNAYVYMPQADATKGKVMAGFGANNVKTYAGAWNSRTSRPVRWFRCNSYNDVGMAVNHSGWFFRCNFRFDKNGASDTAASSGAVIAMTGDGGSSLTVKPLFESCDLVADMACPSASTEIHVRALSGTFAAGEGPGFIGCSIINRGASNAHACILFDYGSKANYMVHAVGCLIGHANRNNATTYTCGSDDGSGVARHDFRSNIHFNTNGGAFEMCADTTNSLTTFAQWQASVDPNAVKTTASAMKFVDITTSSRVLPLSPARASINPADKPSLSLNGTAFAGDYGPYQYQSAGGALLGIISQLLPD